MPKHDKGEACKSEQIQVTLSLLSVDGAMSLLVLADIFYVSESTHTFLFVN